MSKDFTLECPQCEQLTFVLVAVKGYTDPLCPRCMNFILDKMENEGMSYNEALVALHENIQFQKDFSVLKIILDEQEMKLIQIKTDPTATVVDKWTKKLENDTNDEGMTFPEGLFQKDFSVLKIIPDEQEMKLISRKKTKNGWKDLNED